MTKGFRVGVVVFFVVAVFLAAFASKRFRGLNTLLGRGFVSRSSPGFLIDQQEKRVLQLSQLKLEDVVSRKNIEMTLLPQVLRHVLVSGDEIESVNQVELKNKNMGYEIRLKRRKKLRDAQIDASHAFTSCIKQGCKFLYGGSVQEVAIVEGTMPGFAVRLTLHDLGNGIQTTILAQKK